MVPKMGPYNAAHSMSEMIELLKTTLTAKQCSDIHVHVHVISPLPEEQTVLHFFHIQNMKQVPNPIRDHQQTKQLKMYNFCYQSITSQIAYS